MGQDESPQVAAVRRALTASAVTLACAFFVLLGVRTLSTPDLGYHLAYGEHFLDTGRIVDDSLGLYPTIPPEKAKYDLPPGAWIDASGSYRFPNANWLSQVVLALVHRGAGVKGLSVLLAVLVAGLAAAGLVALRRLGAGGLGMAAGLVLMAMVAYERFLLRPELFGYLVLAWQLCLLNPPARAGEDDGAGPSWPAVAGLIVLQALLVNLHSYFLLGLGLTGAAAAAHLGRFLWGRLRKPRDERGDEGFRQRGVRLGAAMGGQVLVCFLNPWTWRLAVLPIQTLRFMSRHRIAGAEAVDTGHPWAIIGEFFRPFAWGVFEHSRASYAYGVLLGVAGLGLVAALTRRRWAHALTIAGMAAVSLTMRRNIAPAAILLTPLAVAACGAAATALRRRMALRPHPAVGLTAAGLLAAAGLYGVFSVVTHRFYRDERRAIRFGLGVTPTVIPVGAAAWISDHHPAGRVWTDYNCSSNLHYFTQPHRPVPVLTNTWAYAPDVMRLVLDCSLGRTAFGPVAESYGCKVVVLQMDRTSIALGRELVADPNWSLVYLGALHVVFLRADGENAALAGRFAITPRTLDVPAYIERLRRMDPVGSYSIYLGGFTLAHLGWDAQAIEVIGHVLREYGDDPYRHRLWNMMGTCYARRGTLRMLRQPPDFRGKQDWHEARNCFLQAMKARPDYPPAQRNLAEVERQIADEKRGILYQYPW